MKKITFECLSCKETFAAIGEEAERIDEALNAPCPNCGGEHTFYIVCPKCGGELKEITQ